MADRPGVEPATSAGSGGAHIFVTGEIARLNAEVTCVVGDRYRMAQEVMVTFAHADTAIQHDRVAEVIFGIHCAEGILGTRLAPGLRIVVAHIVGVGHLSVGTDLHALLRSISVAFGVPDVRRQTQAIAAEIQAQNGHVTIDALVIPFCVAGLLHAVETDPELVVFAKPTGYIDCSTHLPLGGIAGGELGDRFIRRAFGDHVDAPADTASRRNAVDQLARPLEDVHPFGHFHVDRVSGQDAVQAVVGNVAVEQAEAANGELLVAPACGVGGAHRRVTGDQIAKGSGLLVFHRVLGVGGHAEWRFHEVPRTQHALRAFACHLTARVILTVRDTAVANDRRGGELQTCTGALRCRDQRVSLLPDGHQLQAGTLQQTRKPFLDRELAGQPRTVPAIHQCRVYRQIDPGLPGKTGKRGAQTAGRHFIGPSARCVGPTGRDEQRTGTQRQQQAEMQKRTQTVGRHCGHRGKLSYFLCTYLE